MAHIHVSRTALLALVAAALTPVSAFAQFSFQLLPSEIPAGDGFSATFGVARGISGDGNVIVGSTNDYANERAVVWRRGPGGWTQSFLPMANAPDGRASGRAVAASFDGSTIVGSTGGRYPVGGPPPFRSLDLQHSYVTPSVPAIWRAGNSQSPTLEMPIAPGGSVVGNATGVSSSGHAIAIATSTRTPAVQSTRIGRIVNNTISYITPETPGTFESANVASHLSSSNMSSDGNTIAGARRVGNETRAFRWTEAGGIEDLATIQNGSSTVTSISGDGTVVGGARYSTDGFVTNPNSNVLWRNGLADTRFFSGGQITGVSGNGVNLVGYTGPTPTQSVLGMFSSLPTGSSRAMLIEGSRVFNLDAYLIQNGVDVRRIQIFSANAITPDGRTIVGVCALNVGTGPFYSFIATIPTPGASISLLAGLSMIAVRRRR